MRELCTLHRLTEACALDPIVCCQRNRSECCPRGCTCLRASAALVCATAAHYPRCDEVRPDQSLVWWVALWIVALSAWTIVRGVSRWCRTSATELTAQPRDDESESDTPSVTRRASSRCAEDTAGGAHEDDESNEPPSYTEAVPC